MHMRQLLLGLVGGMIILGLVFSGLTFSLSSTEPISLAPTAQAGAVVQAIAEVISTVSAISTIVTIASLFVGCPVVFFPDPVGFIADQVVSSVVGMTVGEQIFSGVVLACAAGLICGDNGGGDVYNAPVGATTGSVCYGPVNSCGRANEGVIAYNPSTGHDGCMSGGSFDISTPPESLCPGSTNCTLPNSLGGGSIRLGDSITAYRSSSVPEASTCSSVSETRTCREGNVLSGSYTNASCTVTYPPPGVSLNAGGVGGDIAIDSGTPVTITWDVTGRVDSCRLASGEVVGTSGTMIVSPTETSSYQISCTGPGGTTSVIRTVTVYTPLVRSFSASPTRVKSGDTVRINWDVSEVASCVVKRNGTDWGSGLSGNTSDPTPITSQTTYTLVCLSRATGAPIPSRSAIVNLNANFSEF